MSSVVPLVLGHKLAPEDTDLSLLSRPDLATALYQAAQSKLCLIHAPTGSGKSVLISQYYHQYRHGIDIAWMKLDTQDCDPIAFFRHLCHAIRHVEPDFAGFSTLQQHGLPNQQQAFLASNNFIMGLRKRQRPLQIIIDNFEILAESDWLNTFQWLIDLSPEHVHWIIAGRNVEGIDPHPWQLRDAFSQLTQTALFFNLEETRAFLCDGATPAIDESLLQTLFRHSKGWPASLKLSQIYLQLQPSSESVDPSLFGRPIFNSLCEKVLASMDAELRHFLVNIAFLEGFSAPLCDHIFNTRKSAGIIARLQKLALFIEPEITDDTFQLHQLMRNLLAEQFTLQPPPVRDRMIARACTWLIDHQQREHACRIARQHSQPSFFTELLRVNFRHWMRTGEAEPVIYWTQQLGEHALHLMPDLRFAGCWAQTMFGELVKAEDAIRQALPANANLAANWEILFELPQTPQRTATAIIYAIIRLFRGDMQPQLLENLGRLYKLPSLSSVQRASIDNIFAQHGIHQCHFREARQRATQAVQVMQKAGNLFGHSLANYLIANSYYQNNDIRQAQEHCENYLQSLDISAGKQARALVEGFSIFLKYQNDQPLLAEQQLSTLMLQHQPGYSIDLQLFLAVPQLHMQTRRKEYLSAHFLVQQLEESVQASASQLLQAHTLYERVRLTYTMGKSQALEQLAETHQILSLAEQALDHRCPLQWEIRDRQVMTAVLILLHRGEWRLAQQWTQQLQYLNVDHGCPIRFLPLNLCLAYLDYRTGQISSAFRRLNDTLTQADATGMLTGLLDDIPDLDDFVRMAINQNRILDPHHLGRLHATGILELASATETDSVDMTTAQIALDALGAGTPIPDIADRINLSVEATRWHLQHWRWLQDEEETPLPL